VSDRIAQMVVKTDLEGSVDEIFHVDSYGYRPNRSAIEAVGVARQRCWSYEWVLDLDIKGFFDNLDHELLMRAVRKHTECKWALLYIERWLKVPAQLQDGTLVERMKGTPQGGVVSPLLANIFLHYAFDEWMRKKHPEIPFERYADDVIVHVKSEKQAKWLKQAIEERLKHCKLELHPEKTKIVYCKDGKRQGSHTLEKFDFLGFTFRPRRIKSRKGGCFVGFTPAVSEKAAKAMRLTIRRWKFHLWSGKSIEEVAAEINPTIRGWINYYGSYCMSALRTVFVSFNRRLERWVIGKYKKLKFSLQKARRMLGFVRKKQPDLFAHWKIRVLSTTSG
jgi:RNA-directed DNA polymerase